MKKLNLTLVFALLSILLYSQDEQSLQQWLKAGPVSIHKPAFSAKKDIHGKPFSNEELIKELEIHNQKSPVRNQEISVLGQKTKWEELTVPQDSIIYTADGDMQVLLLTSYIELDQWASINFDFSSNGIFQVYIDGNLKHTKSTEKLTTEKVTAELNSGKHRIDIKIIGKEETKFSAKSDYNKDEFKNIRLAHSLNPKRSLTIHDILNGENINSASISPSGKYIIINYKDVQEGTGESLSYRVLKNMKTGSNEVIYRDDELNQVKWLPQSDRLSYTVSINDATNLYIYNPATGQEKQIAEGLTNLAYYQWAPDEQKIIYSIREKAEEPEEMKRIYGNEDRIPGFRDRSFLKLLDVQSGDRIQLTAGNLSSSVHDIHPNGKKFIFSTSYPDYTEIPYSKQNLYEMDLRDFSLDTIWKDKQYAGWVQYAPQGNTLLVQGGPLCFENVGVHVSGDKIPNNYDGQLYLYDRQTMTAKSLTYHFDPAVSSAEWIKEDEIYIKVNERDYIHLYRYDLQDEIFEKIDLEVEVLGQVDFARTQPNAVYTGTSITSPEGLYYLNLKKEKSELIDQPENMQNIQLGNTKEWNFTNKEGNTIYGRVYYPPNYDDEKHYPVIVYYYGGTSPVERSFGGRYPKNAWAAKGYIVYVLQPSGATGFGQDFSALHVKGWGKQQTDDIIEGTRKFLEAHPSADKDNVGAIGASYGGYTTMFLQTQTDLFKTAVSHAGISSISSYWGEGYWGYSYSAVASYDSYPWNDTDLYIEHSPLYNADKFNNSILLLHGTADTNVPVGESKQFYAALKILGKDAEMVLIKDQNHWVVDYSQRIKWHHTILSWFDKELKNMPQQWENMYPEKHLK